MMSVSVFVSECVKCMSVVCWSPVPSALRVTGSGISSVCFQGVVCMRPSLLLQHRFLWIMWNGLIRMFGLRYSVSLSVQWIFTYCSCETDGCTWWCWWWWWLTVTVDSVLFVWCPPHNWVSWSICSGRWCFVASSLTGTRRCDVRRSLCFQWDDDDDSGSSPKCDSQVCSCCLLLFVLLMDIDRTQTLAGLTTFVP